MAHSIAAVRALMSSLRAKALKEERGPELRSPKTTQHVAGPGPTFWLSDISDVVITANNITFCAKAVVYPSGGVLNTSSNAHGVELRDDNKLQAVDSPRLCVK